MPHEEIIEMQAAAKVRLLQVCDGNPHRIAALLHNHLLDYDEMPQALTLMEPFTHPSSSDEDRETLRVALRQTIHWHRNYDDKPVAELDTWLESIETYYSALAPAGLVVRHRWLFDSHWVELPCQERDDDIQDRSKVLVHMRTSALEELFRVEGLQGIEQLIWECAEPGTVGTLLAGMEWKRVNWGNWIATKGLDYTPGLHMTWCISSLLRASPSPKSLELLRAVLFIGNQQGWDVAKQARFLALARPDRETWRVVSECGDQVDKSYWQCVQPDLWQHEEDLSFVLQRLLEVKRPRAALQCCRFIDVQIDPKLLFSVLQQYMSGEEPDGSMIHSWYLGEMLEQLEKCSEIERSALIQLEFGLFPALGYGWEFRAAALFESITTEPALFAELIILTYKPRHQERDEQWTEVARTVANHARKILHICKRIPGTGTDGKIDINTFTQFIDSARELCGQADCLTVGDNILGKILAHVPADEDGTWPFSPARDILERIDLEDMRRGFSTEVFNKRGVTCRSLWDGGAQERDLANYYRNQAERVQYTHPIVAAMLEGVAKNYERHGKYQDNEADLRKEGF